MRCICQSWCVAGLVSGQFRCVVCSRQQHCGLESNGFASRMFSFCLSRNVHLPSRHFCTRLSWSDEDRPSCLLWFGAVMTCRDYCKNYLQCVTALRKTMLLFSRSGNHQSILFCATDCLECCFLPKCLEYTECMSRCVMRNITVWQSFQLFSSRNEGCCKVAEWFGDYLVTFCWKKMTVDSSIQIWKKRTQNCKLLLLECCSFLLASMVVLCCMASVYCSLYSLACMSGTGRRFITWWCDSV